MNVARSHEVYRETNLSQSTLNAVGGLQKVSCPTYDRTKLQIGWGHIGCGAFHRAHQAFALDSLLSCDFNRHQGWGLCGINVVPSGTPLCDALTKQDGLYSLLQRDVAGENLRVIGSVPKVICASRDLDSVMSQLVSPSVRLITLTVTEGGYYFDSAAKRFLSEHADIQRDLSGEGSPHTALGLLTLVLAERRRRGIPAPTLLSCDNVCGNGHVLRTALTSFCRLKDAALAAYVESHVAFPNSMVDRITPRTTEVDLDYIRTSYKLNDLAPVVCESFFQWVIEDDFPLGRPAFEKIPGVIFTDDVRPYEEMKLRLLNAGHSLLGYLGHLAGYSLIHEVAGNGQFRLLLDRFWSREVIPNLASVPGISFADYCDTIVARFLNPNLGDQTLRICLDGSAKIPTFVLPSVRTGLANGTSIDLGALCVAAWIRFCAGVGERGEEIPLEDLMATKLRALALAVKDSPNRDAGIFVDGLPEVFGDLSSSSLFRASVSKWLSKLYEHGARATLNECMSTPITGASAV
jgi:mannitol 2-dehydrogenase